MCMFLITQELVLEKESRLRESMKMMGLKSSALFSAWFVKQFLFMMISGFVAVILIKVSTYKVPTTSGSYICTYCSLCDTYV